MFNLILKDLLVQKKSILFAFGYCFFLVFAFQGLEGTAPVTATTAVVYLLIQYSFAHEDKNKSEIMLNSLPISRKDIVLAKYLSIFLYITLAMVAYMLATLLVIAMKIPVKVQFISLQDFTTTLFVVSLMASFYLPVIFKFGYLKAKIFNMLIFLLFFFIPMAIIALYRSSKPASPVQNALNDTAGWPQWQIASLIIGISLLFICVSYLISVRIYNNREF